MSNGRTRGRCLSATNPQVNRKRARFYRHRLNTLRTDALAIAKFGDDVPEDKQASLLPVRQRWACRPDGWSRSELASGRTLSCSITCR